MASPRVSQIATSDAVSSDGGVASRAGTGNGKEPLFDLGSLDLSQRLLTRRDLERWNPHRDNMALLDYIIWHSDDYKRGIALWEVKDNEFWVKGHFPGRPMVPGVLQIEAGAQLAVFMYNASQPEPKLAAFARIEHATFRASVEPGDRLYLLCREIRRSSKRFISDIQGIVNTDKIAFEARISGIAIGMMSELF